MKIKPKLFLGVGALFIMIAVLTAISIICLNRMNRNTKNILQDNYNSLEYCHHMLQALNTGIYLPLQQNIFEENLKLQGKNVTEPGEKEFTFQLVADFEKLKVISGDSAQVKKISKDIADIIKVNMNAMYNKSSMAQNINSKDIVWVSLCGAFSFLVAFVILMNLPGNIADPISQLTESIKEIAAQNYLQRLHFKDGSEFTDLANAFNTMAEKLQEYKEGNLEKLMAEKRRIEALISNLQDPVIGLDEDRRIMFLNDSASKITGLSKEDVKGRVVQDVALHNDLLRSLVQDMFYPSDNPKEPENRTIKIFADQKESYFEKEIIPIKVVPTGETEEKTIGTFLLLQNVTPYKELDFARTNFIANVSHELRTPLSSIKLSLQLLDNGKLGKVNKEQKELLESIDDDANRLLKITGELLNVAQVESGSIQLATMAVDPLDFINYAVNANKIAAEQKNIRLQLDLPDTLPKVLADSEKTAWVITNLISNAIRYSYENSAITLGSYIVQNKVYFTVKDSGQGIPPEYLGKVFDRYFRVPGTKKEGTGLGLSISKEFIEAEGGTISVKSDYGAGTTFTITLNKA